MIWQVPEIWSEGEVWILGGGPSVTKQFEIPDGVVQSVINGSSSPHVYSEYMKALHTKHVIGINVSYLIGNWIDAVFFGDSGFFLAHKERLATFPGLRISCHPHVEEHSWVKYTPRDKQRRFGISNNPNTVCWNGNSGAAAISIAANAGAKRIILLGFDMKLDAAQKQHWHNLYGRLQDIQKKKKAGLPFDRHLTGFTQIAKDAHRRGIEIINVCPDSAITQFPKVNLKDVL